MKDTDLDQWDQRKTHKGKLRNSIPIAELEERSVNKGQALNSKKKLA